VSNGGGGGGGGGGGEGEGEERVMLTGQPWRQVSGGGQDANGCLVFFT
jgi:hypothetical protein